MDQFPVIYRVDADDRIASVNAAWDAFAEANGAPWLRRKRVLDRSIWAFLGDGVVAHVYESLLARIRSGRRAAFRFRCDSPDVKRLLAMDMRAEGADVVFAVDAVSI